MQMGNRKTSLSGLIRLVEVLPNTLSIWSLGLEKRYWYLSVGTNQTSRNVRSISDRSQKVAAVLCWWENEFMKNQSLLSCWGNGQHDLNLYYCIQNCQEQECIRSKAHRRLRNRNSNTYNLILEWSWPQNDADLQLTLTLMIILIP